MVTGVTQTLGVVIANIEDQFFARLVRGVADEARSAGFELVLANSDEDLNEERSAVQMLTEKQVDGLIIAPSDVGESAHLADLNSAGMPIVLLDRKIEALEVDAVLIDGVRAAEEAVGHLLKLGHRRIAIITDVAEGTSAATHPLSVGARLEGYVRSLDRYGVQNDQTLVRRANPTLQGAYEQTLALLASGEPVSAIFTTDNTMTLGALEALQSRSVRIPDEVSLFGFDDLEWTKVTSPPLSVVAQPITELGATAARALLARIADPGRPTETFVLHTTLVHRASTGPPAAA
jgi:LacI family transcriptional regulator